MYSVTIKIKKYSDLLYEALKPEEVKSNRFDVSVVKDGDNTNVVINAKDSTALKAITTSMLKLIEISEKINDGR